MRWLAVEPSGLVRSCLASLPRLEAEESIASANRIAVGGGKLKTEDAARITRAWSSAARGDAGRSNTPDPGALTSMGFAVRRIKRTKKAAK